MKLKKILKEMQMDLFSNFLDNLKKDGKIDSKYPERRTTEYPKEGDYYYIETGQRRGIGVFFDPKRSDKKFYGVNRISGSHLNKSDMCYKFGLCRQTKSWTAGIDTFIKNGSEHPSWMDEKTFIDLLETEKKGFGNYAKSFADFYRKRGHTSGTVDEAVIGGNHPSLKLPPWFKSFHTKLADRFQVEERDLDFKMVHPHLVGVDTIDFSQAGLDNFPTDVRAILRQPEFKGKAIFTFDGYGKIEDRLTKKHPELEDYFDDDEHYWIYIK